VPRAAIGAGLVGRALAMLGGRLVRAHRSAF
jgi:hypothetical protein